MTTDETATRMLDRIPKAEWDVVIWVHGHAVYGGVDPADQKRLVNLILEADEKARDTGPPEGTLSVQESVLANAIGWVLQHGRDTLDVTGEDAVAVSDEIKNLAGHAARRGLRQLDEFYSTLEFGSTTEDAAESPEGTPSVYELPEGMTAEVPRDLADDWHHRGVSHDAEQLEAWADAIDPPRPLPDPDYRSPSVADGTVETTLVEALKTLSDEYGLNGVRKVLEQLADPPKPPSIVTDEMVEAYATERQPDFVSAIAGTSFRADLEAVERLGWTPPCTTCDGHGRYCPSGIGSDGYDMCPDCAEPQWMVEKLTERLAMAEGLLRTLDPWDVGSRASDGSRSWRPLSALRVTSDEAEYLRSLDGEGDS